MTTEIVMTHPLFCGEDLKTLMQLRMFFEHRLLAQQLDGSTFGNGHWIGNPKDVIWQVACHFYSRALKAQLEGHEDLATFKEAVPRIAAGGHVDEFQYPFDWYPDAMGDALSAFIAAQSIIQLMKLHGIPKPPECSEELPLGEFNEHIKSALPEEVIRFRRRTLEDCRESIFLLEDGQFMSGATDWTDSPPLTRATKPGDLSSTTQRWGLAPEEHTEAELCTRWLRDSVLGISPRDVVTEDGDTIKAVPTLERVLPEYLETEEHFYRVLVAAAPGGAGWPRQLCKPVFAKLRDISKTEPGRLDRLLRLLTPDQRIVLDGDLYARIF